MPAFTCTLRSRASARRHRNRYDAQGSSRLTSHRLSVPPLSFDPFAAAAAASETAASTTSGAGDTEGFLDDSWRHIQTGGGTARRYNEPVCEQSA